MPTLSDLVIRTKNYMYGFSQNQQQLTYLTQGIGASDTTFTVGDGTKINQGLIEIDGNTSSMELCEVNTVNRTTNTVTLLPGTRGYFGTTAQSHSQNALVENNPVFPVNQVVAALNNAIRSVYPLVFAVATTKITKLSVVFNYAMPADAEEVISVYYQILGPSKIQVEATNWQFNAQATTTDFAGGKALFLGEGVTPGREIFVTYKKEPSELVNLSDDFATVTGLPVTVQDVVVWRACSALTMTLEGPRLNLQTVESSERAAFLTGGTASKVADNFEQLAMARLQLESQRQYDKYQQIIREVF